MGASVVGIALLVAFGSAGQNSYRYGNILDQEVQEQNEAFQRWWNEPLEWRFDELPTQSSVPEYRVPYSGFIYPDGNGGVTTQLAKYDKAFNGGGRSAASYERRDIVAHRQSIPVTRRGGLFGRRSYTTVSVGTPYWHGHCNGWAAAAIRHAPPEHNVTRNGVVFSPADIKGLLSELYVYNGSEYLGGRGGPINPALFHVVMTNWIGRMQHPVAMESDPGDEVWNYPLYSFATSFAKRAGGRQVEVKMNARYAHSVNRESNEPVRTARDKYFHYVLNLDADGKIVGGRYYGGSSQLDMLWAPLAPRQGGTEGNKQGNPYLDAETVLALWRESANAEVVEKWVNIDVPTAAAPEGDESLLAADATEEDAADEAVEPSAEDAADDDTEATSPAAAEEAPTNGLATDTAS